MTISFLFKKKNKESNQGTQDLLHTQKEKDPSVSSLCPTAHFSLAKAWPVLQLISPSDVLCKWTKILCLKSNKSWRNLDNGAAWNRFQTYFIAVTSHPYSWINPKANLGQAQCYPGSTRCCLKQDPNLFYSCNKPSLCLNLSESKLGLGSVLSWFSQVRLETGSKPIL